MANHEWVGRKIGAIAKKRISGICLFQVTADDIAREVKWEVRGAKVSVKMEIEKMTNCEAYFVSLKIAVFAVYFSNINLPKKTTINFCVVEEIIHEIEEENAEDQDDSPQLEQAAEG